MTPGPGRCATVDVAGARCVRAPLHHGPCRYKPRVRAEAAESRELVEWLRAREIVFLHVPNEGMRSPAQTAWLRAQGLSAGAPDFLIFSRPPRAGSGGAAIEMKRVAGGRTTPEQRRWLDQLQELGWQVTVTKGAAEAIAWLEALGY